MSPECAEQPLRDWRGEFMLELEALAGPPPSPDERMRRALDIYRTACAEALAEGVEPPAYPVSIAEAAIESVTADDDPDRRVVIEEAAAEIVWAAGRIEEFVRFEMFDETEAQRRRQLAEVVRRRALRHKRRFGGSYLAARLRVMLPPRRQVSRTQPLASRPRRACRAGRSRSRGSPAREPEPGLDSDHVADAGRGGRG